MNETESLPSYEPPQAISGSPEDIQKFAQYIHAGVNAWINAGALLVAMKQADPDVFDKILQLYPGISWDILKAFENIGLKRVYPYLMLDNCPGSRKLLTMPYDQQVRLYQAKIDVVTGFEEGQPIVEKKRIQQLNSFEIDRIFFGERIKSIPEQAAEYSASKKHLNQRIQKRIASYSVPRPVSNVDCSLESINSLAKKQLTEPSQPVEPAIEVDHLAGSAFEHGNGVEHGCCGIQDFDFAALDGSVDQEDATTKAAEGLRAILDWVWRLDQDRIAPIQTVLLRFAALTQTLCPKAMCEMTYKEIGDMFGVSKQAVGKQAMAFEEHFGFKGRNTQSAAARKHMSETMKDSHARRKAE